MTDQRPIDPSTLRDGDIVRAKRGEHGVVEGVFEWNGRNWRIKSDDAVRASIADSWQNGSGVGDWTITDILRPVLVKGDRVVWTNVVTPKQGTYVGPHEGGRPGEPHLSVVTNAEGRDIIVETDFLTRLPTAPEPAPIEVGDWWADMPTQADVLAWVADRWPNRTTPIWRAGKLSEEAGEVMGAVIKVDEGRKTVEDIRMEAAQVVICAMGLAESVGFDLWQAVADEWKRSGDTRLPAAPESDPVCPFPMGARVVPVDGWTKAAKIVTDWHPVTPGAPFVVWTRPESMPDGCETWAPADYWTLAPEPAPITVGSWWRQDMGEPHVVSRIGDTGNIWLRPWTLSGPDICPEPSAVREHWTTLDGPPEPPVGSVGIAGPVVFEATEDGIEITGSAFVEPWPAFCKRYGTWLATLRILGSVD